MKIAINQQPYDGPWGGGNRFVSALTQAARIAGHVVVHALGDSDIDIILVVDPRLRSPNVHFGAGAILRYLALRNPNAIVVHRINECDERKGESFINAKLVRANYVADATVFVGEWITQLPIWREHLRPPWFVVRNGSDSKLFSRQGFVPWSGQGLLSLVTHHWGYHPMKGFDVYTILDAMLAQEKWHNRLAFTYVGNLPKGFKFTHARYVTPLDGETLAAALKSHHAYVTASINEPGGHHQNEAALCGLPLLYRQSGCMPEYCAGFGVPFAGPGDIDVALQELMANYQRLAAAMPTYPWTAERMTREWLALFNALLDERGNLVVRRQLWRDPWLALVNQVV